MTISKSKQRSARWLILGIGLFIAAAAVVLWRYTPLAEWASPERVAEWMERVRTSPWAPVIVVGAFIVGGFIMFPLTLLITATAVVFSPAIAIILSLAGSIANAFALYLVGHRLMRNTMTHAFGSYVEKLRRALDRSGVIAVATVRMVPIAPFTLVNLAAGAIDVRLRDYLLGTILGLLPGTIALTAFGHQIRAIIDNPTPMNVGLLVAAVAGWILLSLGLQRLVSRMKGASSH